MLLDNYNDFSNKKLSTRVLLRLIVKFKSYSSLYLYNYPNIIILLINLIKRILFFNNFIINYLELFKIDIKTKNNLNIQNKFKKKLHHILKTPIPNNIVYCHPKKTGFFSFFNSILLVESWCKNRDIEFIPSSFNWQYEKNINDIFTNYKFINIENHNLIEPNISNSIKILTEARNELKRNRIINDFKYFEELKNFVKKKYIEFEKLLHEQEYVKNNKKILYQLKNKNIFNIQTGGKSFETVVSSKKSLVNILKDYRNEIDLILCEDSNLLKYLEIETGIPLWDNKIQKNNNNLYVKNKSIDSVNEIIIKFLILCNANKIYSDPLSNLSTGPLLITNKLYIHDIHFPYSNEIIIP